MEKTVAEMGHSDTKGFELNAVEVKEAPIQRADVIGSPAAMIRISVFVDPLAVVQEREKFNDVQVSSAHLTDYCAMIFYAGPMRDAMATSDINPELCADLPEQPSSIIEGSLSGAQ